MNHGLDYCNFMDVVSTDIFNILMVGADWAVMNYSCQRDRRRSSPVPPDKTEHGTLGIGDGR